MSRPQDIRTSAGALTRLNLSLSLAHKEKTSCGRRQFKGNQDMMAGEIARLHTELESTRAS
jgi:hypothetical protein